MKELMEALGLVSPALLDNEITPVLSHLCFSPGKVFAYNDQAALVAEVEHGLRCAVPGATLISIMENCSDTASLAQHGPEVLFSDHRTKVKLPTLNDFQWDPDEKLPTKKEATVDASLITAFQLVTNYSSEEAVRPELGGVTMVLGRKHCELYGTDNVVLVKAMAKTETTTEATHILPRKSCELLTKTFASLGDELKACTLSMDEGRIVVRFRCDKKPNITLMAKTVRANPADFDKILTTNGKGAHFVKCRQALFDAARRASILTGLDPDKSMTLAPQGATLLANATGSLGELKAEISLRGEEAVKCDPYVVDPDKLLSAQPWAQEIGLGAQALLLRGRLGEDGATVECAIARKE